MTVLLINSGNDYGISGNANAQCYPPLGIISLATCIEIEFQNEINIVLLDGQVDDVETLITQINLIKPDLVGISMYCTSIRNTIKLTKAAKSIGATTLLGNDHASLHYRNILEKVEEVDFICLGDVGEDTIVDFIYAYQRVISFYDVPNLAFKANGIIHQTLNKSSIRKGQKLDKKFILDDIPIPNRSLLSQRYWDYYLEMFRKQKHKALNPLGINGVATVNRARGCARKKNPCKYCGIADLTLRRSSSEYFWKDVTSGSDQVNANFFYESFDSATSWPLLLESWIKDKPKDLDISFFMYSQANETNKSIVNTFKNLGVKSINTGFDSGDDFALKLLKGNKDSLEQNKKSALLWSEANIQIHASFVLLGLGNDLDTRKSLDNTLVFAEWLAQNTLTMSLDTAALYPDKSSIVGNWLWNPKVAEIEAHQYGWGFIDFNLIHKLNDKWKDAVYLDPLELSSDFAKLCGTNFELLMEYDNEIQKISNKYELNFGRSQSGPTS